MFDSARHVDSVPIEDIQEPTRDEKLHPPENEDSEEWEEFKKSVGTSPITPPLARKTDDGYEIIVGDRRLRAMKENGADTIDLRVVQGEVSQNELYAARVAENYHRKSSDRDKKSWTVTQLSAPALLPPAERDKEVEQLMKKEVAEMMGVTGPRVSQLLKPLKNKNPLRAALCDTAAGRRPDEEDIEVIDNIVGLLNGQQGHKVLATGEEGWVSDSLGEMEDVSLGEIEMMAEKAVEEGWGADTFLEEIRSEFVSTPSAQVNPKKESGPLTGEDPYADDSPARTRDDGVDGGIETDRDDPENRETETPDRIDFGEPNVSVEWDELIDDSDLSGVTDADSVTDLTRRRYQDVALQDDAAIAINVLAEISNQPKEEVIRKFVQPAIAEAAARFVEEHASSTKETEKVPAE
jgi:hypothetical protein